MSTTEITEEYPPEENLPEESSSHEESPQNGERNYVQSTPYFTLAIVSGFVLVFVAEILIPMNAVRLLVGLQKPYYHEQFEFWRLLSSAVVHDGLIHLLFNGYAMFILGRLMETITHRSNVSSVFLLAAIGGGILSTIFVPEGNSVGASGGVIGLLGYLTAYGYKRRRLLSNALLKSMLFNIAFIGFVGVFIIPNVDNFGHLGGLIAGIIFGMIEVPSDLTRDPREAGTFKNYLGIAALIVSLLTALLTAAYLVYAYVLYSS